MEQTYSTLDSTLNGVRLKHYPRGQIILYQGDETQDALILKNGVVKMYDIDEQGNEKILHLFKPYAVMPFSFFSDNRQTIQWFYTALTDCDICVLPAGRLVRYMAEDDELMRELVNWFSSEVHELLVRLDSLGKTNAYDKVVAALKFLAVRQATARRSGWRRVNFPVSHQLIADMTGLTRESAATIMHELHDEGIIRNPRQTVLEMNGVKLLKNSPIKTAR